MGIFLEIKKNLEHFFQILPVEYFSATLPTFSGIPTAIFKLSDVLTFEVATQYWYGLHLSACIVSIILFRNISQDINSISFIQSMLSIAKVAIHKIVIIRFVFPVNIINKRHYIYITGLNSPMMGISQINDINTGIPSLLNNQYYWPLCVNCPTSCWISPI